MRKFLKSDSLFLKFLLSFLVSVLALLPNVWALGNVPRGYSFVGINTFANFYDVVGVYFSAIQQSFAGSLVYINPFDLGSAKIFHYPVYVGIGKVAQVFDLTTEFVYLFFSFFLALIFSLFLLSFVKLFLKDKGYMYLTFMLCNFGGLFVMAVPESNAFFSYTFPHFVVALLALFSMIYCLIYYLLYTRRYYIFGILLSALVLSIVHPWMCIPLAISYFLWVVLLRSRGRFIFRDFLPILIILATTIPFLIYYKSNINWTSFKLDNDVYLFLVLYGGILLFTLIGLWRSRGIKRDNPLFFLGLWFFVELFFCYSPLPFSKRFYEGMFFPISVFAVIGIDHFLKKKLFDVWLAYVVIPFFLCVGVIGSYMFHFLWLPNDFLYRDSDEFVAVKYLYSVSNFESRVLSVPTSGNFLAGHVNSSFYVGHHIQTPNFAEKSENSKEYYSGQMSYIERAQFVTTEKICYVFFGTDEKRISNVNLDNEQYLSEVFNRGNVSIYKSKFCN